MEKYQENKKEEKPSRLLANWKRILVFSLFFSLLVGSLLYYALPRVLHPLRIDSIPPDAYIVPWMRLIPSLEELEAKPGMGGPPWNIDSVMADALKLNMTFRIVCQHGTINETRIVPSTVYLGHDEDYLYVGGKFRGMGLNPASTPNLTLYNYFDIFFDVTDDGLLNKPESGSSSEVAVGPEVELRNDTDSWRSHLVWSYDDLVWTRSPSPSGRFVWLRGEDYYWPNAQPAFALGNMDVFYDQTTETLVILFSRYLWRPASSEINALQMKRGERWVMGFLFELGYNTWYGGYTDFVDGWLRKIYPYLDNDASWWPKLVIDLSNPPPEFST